MKFETREVQSGGFLHVGLFEAKVVGLNMTREQMKKWRGWEDKPEDGKEPKEYDYVGEDKDKNTRITLAFCVEDVNSTFKTEHRIMITDKESVSEKSGKKQWVNQLGMATWVDDEKNLPNWFTAIYEDKEKKKKIADLEYREAKMGEADLYEFMRNWLTGKTSTNQSVNWYGKGTNILVDTKKLFRGKIDEIKDHITAPEDENVTGTVVIPATVYIKDSDDGKKMYQNTAKVYLPGWKMKTVRLSCTQNSWDADKSTKKFKDQILDPQYGIKDAFVLDLLKPFDENEHLQATDQVIRHDDSAPADTDF